MLTSGAVTSISYHEANRLVFLFGYQVPQENINVRLLASEMLPLDTDETRGSHFIVAK